MVLQERFTFTWLRKKLNTITLETREDATGMTIKETYYHPIEIIIPSAGSKVDIKQALPLTWDEAVGVIIVNLGGSHGKGTLELSVAGEEIFPGNFHARAFMQILSSNRNDEILVNELDKYLYEFREEARGATISATYKEPGNGTSGILYLYLKLTREKTC